MVIKHYDWFLKFLNTVLDRSDPLYILVYFSVYFLKNFIAYYAFGFKEGFNKHKTLKNKKMCIRNI